ncbi:MAG: hypothetical protein H6621_05010 [Halobacteriovoraceae bacterium]|nr:hypothetical protein [Halobacteriovoraceae bacterium]
MNGRSMSDSLETYQIRNSHFHELAENIESERVHFVQKLSAEQAEKVRSKDQALSVLKLIDFLRFRFDKLIEEKPHFKRLVETEFCEMSFFDHGQKILQKCFLDENLFDKNDYFVLSVEGQFNEDIVRSGFELYENWEEEIEKVHERTYPWLKNTETKNLALEQLECRCSSCLSLYRSKVRDYFVTETKKMLDKFYSEMEDFILERSINNVSDKFFHFQKKIDGELKKIRHKLRKGSYNKIYTEIKNNIENLFSSKSENDLIKTYKEKLKAYLVTEVSTVSPDFFDEEELNKFFGRLRMNIWKPASFLRREFLRFTESLITLKRKDISSTILRDYLGQFWLHSPARRKNRKIIYHMGPTNSGKTHHAINALSKAPRGCYLAPLRLLASENFDRLNDMGVVTTLLTGEEVIEKPEANHYSSTIEMAKIHEEFDCVVIDEIQMIADAQRGWAWTRALIHMNSPEVHLCGDHSAFELVQEILKLTGDELEVKQYERMTKLSVENKPVDLKDLQRGDALIVFSRKKALQYKGDLENHGHTVSIVYGRLNPDVRREQARRFDEGETDIIVATDAISMGMNLPVRRIVFTAFSKFINSKEYELTESEIKQISGRAGRYQRFPEGFVNYLPRPMNQGGFLRLQEALGADLADKEWAMVGPDLEIFQSVNRALEENNLRTLKLSEFLRLFYTMEFDKPFYCVRLDEMIEIAEMVEEVNEASQSMSASEIFGFSCAPVNLGHMEHVEYFHSIASRFANGLPIINEEIDVHSRSIDYLETAIKCVELFQWLARHFNNKHFEFDDRALHINKSEAIERLNDLLSEKNIKYFNPFPKKRNYARKRGEDTDKNRTSRNRNKSNGKFAKSGKKHSRRRRPQRKNQKDRKF